MATTHISIGNGNGSGIVDPAMLLSPPASPVPPGGANRFRSSASSQQNASTAAPRSLALKISRLLSATLEDAGTRSALETLNEFALFDGDDGGIGNGHGAGDPAAATATTTRSTKSRKLRAEIDKRLLDDSQRFLAAFKEVNEKLTDLQSHLASMHSTVDSVQNQLTTANSGTKHLLASAASLRTERLATADRQAIAAVFLRRFTLSDREIRAMTSRESPVNRELFDAIERTERIRDDCRVLMSGDAAEEAKAGMEIMLQTSQHLDAAFSKLHKYTTFAARNYTTRPEVLDNVSPTLRRALQLLKANRSDLLDDTLNVLSSTRSSAISNMFIEALTRGTPEAGKSSGGGGGRSTDPATSRPIELHAHDPIRYVGDILAWVHQAMASEREFLESLFGIKDSGRLVGAARPSLPCTDGDANSRTLSSSPSASASASAAAAADDVSAQPSDEARLRTLLDKNLESCGRPLRIRIQQTIKSHALISAITTYQIFQLLQFYRVLMRKVMGARAGLCAILDELARFASASFFQTLDEHARALAASVAAPGVDLKPPVSVRDAMGTLREIMQVHHQSLLDDEDRTELDDFEAVLEAAVEPVLQLVDRMKALKAHESERHIFEINSVVFVLSTLETAPEATRNRTQQMDARLKQVVEALTALHFQQLLKETGLEPIVAAMRSKADDEPLSLVPAASSRALTAAIRTFDAFLSHTDTLSSPRLSLLSSPRLAAEIHHEALKRVVAAYAEVWDEVMAEKNRYEFRSTVLHRSKEEVAMLLAS